VSPHRRGRSESGREAGSPLEIVEIVDRLNAGR
jgi:hypothetical protein